MNMGIIGLAIVIALAIYTIPIVAIGAFYGVLLILAIIGSLFR